MKAEKIVLKVMLVIEHDGKLLAGKGWSPPQKAKDKNLSLRSRQQGELTYLLYDDICVIL